MPNSKMDPNLITVSNLKKLNAMNLSTSGNKNELILRLNQADPSGEWMGNVEPEISGRKY